MTRRILILFVFLFSLKAYAYTRAYISESCTEKPSVMNEPDWMSEIQSKIEDKEAFLPGYLGWGVDFSAIFGDETRVLVDKPVYPWTAIGKISNDDRRCTGTLVGECIVATAAHCIHFNEEGRPLPLSFEPRFGIPGQGHQMIQVTTVSQWQRPDEERKSWVHEKVNFSKDWALVRVSGRPGKKFGFLGVKGKWLEPPRFYDDPAPIDEVRKFYVAGYSGDFQGGQLSVDMDARNISLESPALFASEIFNYESDNSSGSSGGPILEESGDNFYLMGVNSRAVVSNEGEAFSEPRNHGDSKSRAIGVPADYFLDEIKKLRALGCED